MNILILSAEPERAAALDGLLRRHGYHTHVAVGPLGRPQELLAHAPDLILLDLSSLGDRSPDETLAAIGRLVQQAGLPLIALADNSDLEFALVDVYDYLAEPLDSQRLLADIARLDGLRPDRRAELAPLSDADLAAYQEFLAEHSGLHFTRSNIRLLQQGLHRRVCAVGAASYADYYDYLQTYRESRNELKKLLSLLTVGETSFFRYRNQRAAFVNKIMPELITRRQKEKRLAIWSAGCSTGEEPYSIALLLAEQFPELDDWDVEILATDINKRSLRIAREGVYNRRAVRFLDATYLEKYFKQVDKFYLLDRNIRERVTFSYLNLQDCDYPSVLNGTDGLDLVFCRNVMIYFQPATMRRIVEQFSRCLRPAGCLVMGHSETLQNIPSRFQRRQSDKAFYYQLPEQPVEPSGVPGVPAVASRAPAEVAVEPASTLSVRQTFLQAEAAFRQEEYVRAEALYDAVLAAEPRHLQALVGKGLVAANLGRFAEARSCCAKAISVDDLFAGTYFLKGLVLDMEEQAERALVEYQKVLWLDPCFVAAHYALARISLRRGQNRDARRQLLNTVRCLEKERASLVIPYSGGLTREVFLEQCRQDLASLPSDSE